MKNLVVKPSGPGALSGFMIERACLTSFMVMGAVRGLLSSKEIRWGMRSKGWEEMSIGSSIEAVKRSEKFSTAAFFIHSGSWIRAPSY